MPTLAELQNPYASLNLNFGLEEELEKRAYVKRTQNPWAAHELLGEHAAELPSAEKSGKRSRQSELNLRNVPSHFVSKVDFRGHCRDILRQYQPMDEGHNRLRPALREFIEANVNKSGATRAAILVELDNYDLSSMGSLNPQLNREGDTLLQKLEKITQKYSA